MRRTAMIKRWAFLGMPLLLAVLVVAVYGEAAEQHVVMEIEGMTCNL